jgi:hypothetical protein
MHNLPGGYGAPLIRTDFTNQAAWDDLCGMIRQSAPEGLLTDMQIVDDPSYQGVTSQQILTLVPPDCEYSYLALVDEITTASQVRTQDRTLLIIDLDDEDPGGQFRTVASELASIDANLSTANLDFHDYADGVGEDGVYRGF